jgi:hypothetical protein
MPLETVPANEADATRRIRDRLLKSVRSSFDHDGFAPRDAHPKAHGVVHATLTVDANIDPALQHGVFGTPGVTYKAWVRFSNAAESRRPDHKRDVHGMAVKVMGVTGDPGVDGARSTQDFVMIDDPRFFIPDAALYAKFFDSRLKFALNPFHWRLLYIAFRMQNRLRHPMDPSYFSATPYLLGPHAIKYRAEPLDDVVRPPRRASSPDRMYEALLHQLADKSFRFAMSVQRQGDVNRDRIEDPTRAWGGKFEQVAVLEIPSQDFSHGPQTSFGERLSFDPWNTLAAHRPLGGINRVRKTVYDAISRERHALNREPREEPSPSSIADVERRGRLHPSVHENVRQTDFAVAADVDPDQLDSLRELLAAIDAEAPKGCTNHSQSKTLPLHAVSSLHFARLVMVSAPPDDKLILSVNFDGERDAFLNELIAQCGPGLRKLFSKCKGFDDSADLRTFMLANHAPSWAFYVGAPGRTVQRIRAELDLRERIEAYLDDPPPGGWGKLTARQIRTRVQHYVFHEISREWQLVPPPPHKSAGPKLRAAGFAAGALLVAGLFVWLGWPAAVVTGTVGLLAYAVWRLFIYYLRHADVADDEHRREVEPREDFVEGPEPVQNWLTHVVELKPSWFRQKVLRAVLFVIDLAAKKVYVTGHLDGIRTILFARWLAVDNPKRLVFFSNYGGTWEAYLDEFIDEAAGGLTSIWSNTVDFPRTRPFFVEGAKHGEEFKRWTRHHQVDTGVWYAAYPTLSVSNVIQNSSIRLGLYGSMSEKEAARWLRLFGRA